MTTMDPETQDPMVSIDSGALPDSNTAEAILYGKEYSKIKTMMWAWDEMEDHLYRRSQALESEIIDRDFAYMVLTKNRHLINSRSPPFNEVNKIKDLFTLNELVRVETGIKKIQEYRRQNQTWGRKRGIEEYVASLSGKGISPADWKNATAKYNMAPITFDYVHGNVETEDDVDWALGMRLLLGDEEFEKFQEKVEKGIADPRFADPVRNHAPRRRPRDIDPFDIPELDNLDDETEETEDFDEPPMEIEDWDYLQELLEPLVTDNVSVAIDSLPDADSEDVKVTLAYLEAIGPDNTEILGFLLDFMGEA
ncbi:MAG: hypothetical protein E7Z63_00895 [Thermoplasmata archaeon]|nr:hypothetical protein [Thermoplasmata archaeon]